MGVASRPQFTALEGLARVVLPVLDHEQPPVAAVHAGLEPNQYASCERHEVTDPATTLKFERPYGIGVAADKDWLELDFAHEVGHLLDHQVLGQRGVYASEQRGGDLDEWWEAVTQTDTYWRWKRIQELKALKPALTSGWALSARVDLSAHSGCSVFSFRVLAVSLPEGVALQRATAVYGVHTTGGIRRGLIQV